MIDTIHEPEPSFWQALKTGQIVPLLASGNSMRPFYKSNTWFLVQNASLDSLRRGDLLVMQHARGLVIHRLRHSLSPNSTTLITRGDAYDFNDSPWKTENYKAKVIAVMQSENQNSWRSHNWTHQLTCLGFRFGQTVMDGALSSVRRLKRFRG